MARLALANELDGLNGRHGEDPMTTKERLLQAVKDLPDDATIEDAMERFLFLAKVDRGIKQADAGETLSHDEVKEKMAKWLK